MNPTIRRIPYSSEKPWVLAHKSSRQVWRYDTWEQAIAAVPSFTRWLNSRLGLAA